MKEKSIGINAILNAIKSALSIIFPLITFPYATRVLGVGNLGKVNYAQSIEHYFALFAALGITSYAVREGAKLKNEKNIFSKFCNEIFSLNVITTILSYVVMIIFIFCNSKIQDYRLLILLQSVSILFTTLSVDWLNTIHEDFLFITLRSIVINIISILALFIFVRDSSDYYIYALLTVLTNAIIAISNLFYCKKYAKIKFSFNKNIFSHLKSTLIFFANSLSISIYVNADTTMLGWICGDFYVGIYAVAVKVYNIIKTMLASIYVVAIPRLSYYFGNGKIKEFKNLFSKIVMYLSLLILPAMAGIICLSKDIVIILSGTEYLDAVITLQILSIALLFAIFGGVVTNCLNIPLKKEMINMKATVISAVVNIILNFYFIPNFKQNGAAITSVISEFLVLLICVINFKKWNEVIDVRKILKNILHAFMGVIIVFVICYLIQFLCINNMIIEIFLKVLLSILGYVITLIILKNEVLMEILYLIHKRGKVKNGNL